MVADNQKEKKLPNTGAIRSLRDFLDILKENGLCITWTEPIFPEEIRKIMVAATRDQHDAPAIIYNNIIGYPGKRVVTGVHGSWFNLSILLGRERDTSIKELFFEVADRWGDHEPLLKTVEPGDAPVNENRIEKNFNIYEILPLYRINALDGGFYLGKANVVTRDPLYPDDFGKQNVGIYRIQFQGPDTFTVALVPSHDATRHIRNAEENDLPLKIAVMIGNHPAIALFAATPVAYNKSEFAYASQMMGTPIELTKSGNGIDILAQAEFVIEAELIPNGRAFEGPFGEFPGGYGPVKKRRTFKITAISHRNDFIYESVYIGRGWTEFDTLIGLHTCVPIYDQLKGQYPEVVAVNAIYQHGMTIVISVKNRYPGFAKNVAMTALGLPIGQHYLKNIFLVDEDVDPFNLTEVMWAMSCRVRAKDIIVIDHMPTLTVNPSDDIQGIAHRLVIDATTPLPPDSPVLVQNMIQPPSGPEIEAIFKTIKKLQQEVRKK